MGLKDYTYQPFSPNYQMFSVIQQKSILSVFYGMAALRDRHLVEK